MKKYILILLAVLIFGLTQQVQAQHPGDATKERTSAIYKIHKTPSTKTIFVDGGVTFWGYFSEGRCVIGSKDGWFIINKQGNKVFTLPQGYDPVSTGYGFTGFDGNRLMAYSKSNKKAVIYDDKGNMIKSLDNIEKAVGFSDGVALIMRKEKVEQWNNKEVWTLIDDYGNSIPKSMTITSSNNRLFSPAKNGLARAYDSETKKWGYRDNKFQWVIQPKYAREVKPFCEGLAAVNSDTEGGYEVKGKWGYIDRNGNWAIQPIYTNEPGNFKSGLAMVIDKQNVRHFINKNGSIVWSNDKPDGISSGIREFMDNGKAIWTLDDGIYIVNTSFQKLAKLKIGSAERGAGDKVMAYNDEYFEWYTSWREDGRLIDWNGNVRLFFDCGPGSGQTFCDGICKARNQNYYFNDKGEIIVEFKDTQF